MNIYGSKGVVSSLHGRLWGHDNGKAGGILCSLWLTRQSFGGGHFLWRGGIIGAGYKRSYCGNERAIFSIIGKLLAWSAYGYDFHMERGVVWRCFCF